MAIVEIEDRARVAEILSEDPLIALEALDESALGVAGIVTVFAPEEPRPVNALVVRWGQKNLGLGSLAVLRASRLSGLEELVAAFPADRGQLELLLPFWAAGAVTSAFSCSVLGAEAVYVVDRDRLRPSPVVSQTIRLDDLDVIRPMFPKLADDAPSYVLSLRDQLTAVAAVTHLRGDAARITAYTVDTARRRGFGRGVLTALAEELLALRVTPTIVVDLSNESAVRMVENAGFYQRAAHLKVRLAGRKEAESSAPGASLVKLGVPPRG